MSSWTWQVPFSVIGGALMFFALAIPALVLQYRRYGRPSLARLVVIAAACIYGVALVAYTLLPLPPVEEVCRPVDTGGILNPVPFAFVGDIAEVAGKVGLLHALASFTTLQVVLNVVLFVPLGMLLRGFLGRGLPTTVLIGFLVSLLIESTQYTGDWGLYPCGYRVADVDDLMTNTLGTLLGAVIAPALLGSWVPSARRLERLGRTRPAPVGALRRLLGMLLDWFSFGLVGAVVAICWLIWQQFVLGRPADRITSAALPLRTVGELTAAVLLVIVPALIGSGASLGQRLVSIAPVWPAGPAAAPTDPTDPAVPSTATRWGRGRPGQRLARAAVVGGVYATGRIVPDLLDAAGAPILSTAVGLVTGLWVLLAVVLACVGDHRGLSGRLVGARMVDVRALHPDENRDDHDHDHHHDDNRGSVRIGDRVSTRD